MTWRGARRAFTSWRFRHPLRFARTYLPLVLPLSWRAKLVERMHRRRVPPSPWGDPAGWFDELQRTAPEPRRSSTEEPLVSIHVIAHRNLTMTRLCVQSILRFTDYSNYELVLLDNGSRDGTAEWFREVAAGKSGVRSIVREDNSGFAAACNEAVSVSRGEILCFLNNDVVVSRAWLDGLVEELLRDGRAGLVGPVTNSCANEARVAARYRSLGGMLEFADERREGHAGEAFPIPMLALYCAAMWRRVWNDVGPLDERFMPGMFEDDDYARRLRQRGYDLVCREDAFVHHWGGAAFHLLGERRYFEIYRANREALLEKWRQSRTVQ